MNGRGGGRGGGGSGPFSAPDLPEGGGRQLRGEGDGSVHDRNRRVAEAVERGLVHCAPDGTGASVNGGWYPDGDTGGGQRPEDAHLLLRIRVGDGGTRELTVPDREFDRRTEGEVVREAVLHLADVIPELESPADGDAPPVGDREFRGDRGAGEPGMDAGVDIPEHPDPPGGDGEGDVGDLDLEGGPTDG